MSQHPTPSELGVLLAGGLTPLREQEVLRHLFSCESCRACLKGRNFPQKDSRAEKISPDLEAAYERVLDSGLRIARYLDRETEQARRIAALLQEGGAFAIFSKGDTPLGGFGVYKALIERCWAVRLHQPQQMVSLARCALEVALRLGPEEFSPRQRGDLIAQAWGALGNAFRAADNLVEAERAFNEAFSVFERQGSGDSAVKARLYTLLASLHGTRRIFTLAFAALDVAYTLYNEIGDRHSAGHTLLKKAIYTHYSGQSEEAIKINRKALALIDLNREPDLLIIALHNELSFLVACGHFGEARRTLFKYRPHLPNMGKIHTLKLRWLEGQIDYGLRNLQSAEAAFLEARQGFEEEDLGIAAAMASLDLGLVRMRQHRTREAGRIATEAAQIFTSLQVPVQAIAAVLLLRDSFEWGKATLALYESVVEFVRKSDIDPDAQFIPPDV
ncbi:MAG TPA: tetratricopeptide repeat protein [Thermoanaerobaculia bacterium]|nr:tetratricopeptide repeat protein [Thermoanaerobaculia bacterium]